MIQGNTQEELLESYKSEFAKFQAEMMSKISEAQGEGDFEKVQQLSNEMAEKSQVLVDEYQRKVEALIGGDIEQEDLYKFPCGVDLDLIVYDGDRDSLIELNADPDIQNARKEFLEGSSEYSSRKELLKTSLKLTRKLAPIIYKIGDSCRQTLEMNTEIEFYVYQDDCFNAFCYPPDESRLYIILSSGIIERFTDTELTFVIGHEIGHVLFDHFKYPPRAIMNIGHEYLSPVHAMKLFAWGRSAEVSADRVGLICCKDFLAAAMSFFKLSSGVTSNRLQFDLNEYLKQYKDLSTEMKDVEMAPSDWYSTHPFSPLRIKALELFNKSDTYAKLGGDSESILSEDEMEEEISKFMKLMEPSYLDEDSEVVEEIQNFLFIAGYLIADADDDIDDRETQALGKIVRSDIFTNCLNSVNEKSEDELIEELKGFAKKLNTFLSPMQKLNIIRDLCVMTTADGEVYQCEMDVLFNVCELVNINPEFADKVVCEAMEELD